MLILLSCEDSYMTVERRVIDAENNIPIYFTASAEQDGVNTWRPVFSYYIYQDIRKYNGSGLKWVGSGLEVGSKCS